MRMAQLRVQRSELSTHTEIMFPWEAPILQHIHGALSVKEIGESFEPFEVPDAQGEFDRLASRYGQDNESGIPYVVQVYGQGRIGLEALRQEINKAATAVDVTT
jgi:hypothetical protein